MYTNPETPCTYVYLLSTRNSLLLSVRPPWLPRPVVRGPRPETDVLSANVVVKNTCRLPLHIFSSHLCTPEGFLRQGLWVWQELMRLASSVFVGLKFIILRLKPPFSSLFKFLIYGISALTNFRLAGATIWKKLWLGNHLFILHCYHCTGILWLPRDKVEIVTGCNKHCDSHSGIGNGQNSHKKQQGTESNNHKIR